MCLFAPLLADLSFGRSHLPPAGLVMDCTSRAPVWPSLAITCALILALVVAHGVLSLCALFARELTEMHFSIASLRHVPRRAVHLHVLEQLLRLLQP
jgi:hypothetical protein